LNPDNTLIIILGILIGLFAITILIGLFFLTKKFFSKNTSKKKENNTKKIYLQKLKSLVNISEEEAIQRYIDETKLKLNDERKNFISELKEKNDLEIHEMCSDILIDAMEQIAEDVAKRASTYIRIDESLKGKLIGKEGRNIKVFEKITGVELSFEKDGYLGLSAFNPLRREIAFNLANRLIKSRSIEPSKIEKYYEEEKSKIEIAIQEKGKNVIENILKIKQYIPIELYHTVGRLYYRTSYSQNILTHSTECAKLAGVIARHLGVDETKAKASAFIHDIGKSQDYEDNNDHVATGKQIAEKYQLDDFLVNSILSHHGNESVTSIYSAITKVVDIISSARPGARKISQKEFANRIKTIEAIALNIKGVSKVYAIKSGKEIRVITEDDVDDASVQKIAEILKNKYENNPSCSIRPIDIIVIKEKRVKVQSNSLVKKK